MFEQFYQRDLFCKTWTFSRDEHFKAVFNAGSYKFVRLFNAWRCPARKEAVKRRRSGRRIREGLAELFSLRVACFEGQRRGWPTVFLRAVSADQCGFSCAVISRRLPKLVESLIASKLLLTALFSFLSRQCSVSYLLRFLRVNPWDRLQPDFGRPFANSYRTCLLNVADVIA